MKLNQFFKEHDLELNKRTVLVAVSGGADSMALLTMVLDLRQQFNLRVLAAHIDHDIRSDSYLESELLQNFAQEHDFILFEKKWDKTLHPKNGIEAAAREFRYEFFKEIIEQGQVDYLLTAHHGDDLVENMLLKLIRSGNVAEFNSLKPVRDFASIKLLRPLLSFEKKDLEEFCHQRKIDYIEDVTNQEDFTARNRLRHHVVPKLKEETAGLIENANRLQQGLDGQELALAELINHAIKIKPLINHSVLRINTSLLAQFSNSTLQLILQLLIKQNFGKVITVPVATDLEKNNKVELSQQVFLQIYQGNIYLVNQEKLAKYFPGDNFLIEVDEIFDFAGQKYIVLPEVNSKMESVVGSFFAERDANFLVGKINSTDRLILKNNQHQLPKKRFATQKIPEFLRPYQLTIFSNRSKQVVFIAGAYQNQVINDRYVKYYVYQVLKKDKEK